MDQPAFYPKELGLVVPAVFRPAVARLWPGAFWIGFVPTAVFTDTALNPDFNIALNYPLSPSRSCSEHQQKFPNSVDPTIFLALHLKYWVPPSIIKFLFS